MTAEPMTIAAGSLTDWPIKVSSRLGGWIVVECRRDGCHAVLARVHMSDLWPAGVETTMGAGLVLAEAHEVACPTPAPVEPETCNAYWTIHCCAEQPGHKRAGDGQGHRCKCGDQPQVGDPVRFLQSKPDPLA